MSLFEAICVSISMFSSGEESNSIKSSLESVSGQKTSIPTDPSLGWGLDPWFLHRNPDQCT